MKFILSFLVAHLLVGCGNPSHGSLRVTPAPSEIIKLRSELEDYDYVGSIDDRPSQFNPEMVLKRIHPWLVPGTGLRTHRIGDSSAFILQPIPEQVLQDLNSILYPDSTPVPLLFLRSNFWTRAARLQKEGYQIGFKAYTPRSADVGVYIAEKNILLFDTFAEYGTLSHELEHALQHQKILLTFSPRTTHPELSENCIEQLGRFLGEVDATRVELKEWRGTFSTFEYRPERYRTLREVTDMEFHNFYDSLLMANLNYPSYAVNWVSQSDCPISIKQAATHISEESQDLMQRAHEAVLQLNDLRIHYGWTSIRANTVCSNPSSIQDKSLCEQDQDFLIHLDSLARDASDSIDQILDRGFTERTAFIRKTLNEFSPELKKVLCKNVSSFSILGDCP